MWIPSYVDTPGNELDDKLHAKPVTFSNTQIH